MKRAIEVIIGEMESKLSGYAGLLNYRFMNLCVKAEPAALISITIEDEEGEVKNLEDVAHAMLANDYQYEIIPMDPKHVFSICKGMYLSHPEFKQDIVTPDDENKLYYDQTDEKHILFTVPDVNKDRYDVLMDGVKVLYDQCMVEVKKVNAAYTAKLATNLEGLPEDEIEEAKKKMEDSQQTYSNLIDEYLTNKKKEIEDAYQHYLQEQAAKQAEADEIAAAHNVNAGLQYRVDQSEE